MINDFDQTQLQSKKTQADLEKFSVMPSALQLLARKMKGKKNQSAIEVPQLIVSAKDVFPIAAEIIQADKAKEATSAKVEVVNNFRIGYKAGDKGIFIGAWRPVDIDGKSLGKTFNVFAAPYDLDPFDKSGANCRTYENTAKEVGKRRNWHGHDGIYCENDAALYNVLKDESAIGRWFIPTSDLLYGKNVDETVVRDMHLNRLRKQGDFIGTFVTTNYSDSSFINCYWSCTEHRDGFKLMCVSNFFDGSHGFDSKFLTPMSCRPVRVELAP